MYKQHRLFSGGGRRGTDNITRTSCVHTRALPYRKKGYFSYSISEVLTSVETLGDGWETDFM